jgi:Flp pilus assembly pilin Flp
MKQSMHMLWREDDGVLSFEWTLLVVLIVFGVVGGLAAGRDAIIDELGDLAAGVAKFDQSFTYTGIPALGIPGSSYDDKPGVVDDTKRQAPGSVGIAGRDDGVDGA